MRRTYEVQGRYGYWAVDEHNDQDSGVRDCVTAIPSRKLATAIADALTRAYQDGSQDTECGVDLARGGCSLTRKPRP